MKHFVLLMTCCAFISSAWSQNKPATTTLVSAKDTTIIIATNDSVMVSAKDSSGGYAFSVGGVGGVRISNKKMDDAYLKKRLHVHFIMVDLGVNALNDRTDYSSPAARQYLQVPEDSKNSNLFSMRTAKSINVNVWPVLFDYTLQKSKSQKISLYSGVGMQFYNFRFNKDISFLNETNPMVIDDSVKFSKNKLAFAYVSIPLMLNFKTRLAKGFWLVYGVGAIGGYAFDTWTKQISDERGKQKNHDQFNFQRFNLNLSGEIGIDNYIRLYGTYQVTNMYKNSLVQNPYCIGIRFLGI